MHLQLCLKWEIFPLVMNDASHKLQIHFSKYLSKYVQGSSKIDVIKIQHVCNIANLFAILWNVEPTLQDLAET
jgi:hypothetical protein